MYGQIHCVIRELVQTKFGTEAWETILKKSGLDPHNSFLMFTRYEDSSTFALVGAVSDTLGVSMETVLEIFGEFFFDYCLRHGYDKMLRTLGSDIKSFIQNLDSLHSLLALSYKGIAAPSFRCEDGPNGSLILHYYSGRPGLFPIVKGVVKAVARDLFNQSVEMSIIEQGEEDIGSNQTQQHTAFRVQLRSDSPHDSLSRETSTLSRLVEFNPEIVLLKATDFCSAFPYHIIFDRDLRIRQCGVLVQKHSLVQLAEGTPLTEAFSIVHPKMVLSVDNIRKFINAVFLLALSPEQNGKKTFILKGQMMWIADTQHMIFIGSPRLTSLNELIEMNVYLADIPLYDVTRELVLLNQQRIAEIDIAKRLDETTAELKKISLALAEEKRKTETLLHQMLPRKVARALTHGQKVEAEKFDQVTILFSDIVTFTNIASACSPMDIVNMLNELYHRFDRRTSQHNVYKVETIGDAYMVVSGVPDQTDIHAQPVANFAMDMIEDAGLVNSPATGLPLQIRVGVHTGPVVAGVVGLKMPRYCLFGDTVNTASRMESHGVPGRIHLSPTTYSALRGWGYSFKNRGEMQIKGKGQMFTYFLVGHGKRHIEEPRDEFSDLELHHDTTEVADAKGWLRGELPTSQTEVATPDSDSLNSSTAASNSAEKRLDSISSGARISYSEPTSPAKDCPERKRSNLTEPIICDLSRQLSDEMGLSDLVDYPFESTPDQSLEQTVSQSNNSITFYISEGKSATDHTTNPSTESTSQGQEVKGQTSSPQHLVCPFSGKTITLPVGSDTNGSAETQSVDSNPESSSKVTPPSPENQSDQGTCRVLPGCVYINGSFKNNYHHQSNDSEDIPAANGSEMAQNLLIDATETRPSSIDTTPNRSLSEDRARTPSVARSETFPVPVSDGAAGSTGKGASASHSDLQKLKTEKKAKKRRKHNSKLCSVS